MNTAVLNKESLALRAKLSLLYTTTTNTMLYVFLIIFNVPALHAACKYRFLPLLLVRAKCYIDQNWYG